MQTIILLHGALGSGKDLESLEQALKQTNEDVRILTFSGHGSSEFKLNFGIDQFVNELHNYIQLNNLVKPLVFGYSMGGYVALLLALKEPHLIGKLICLGTKFDWNEEFVCKETKMLDADHLIEKNPAFVNSLQLTHGTQWKELLTRTSKMMRDLAGNRFLSAENLASIKVPVLIGIADHDKMVSLAETVTVFQTLPNAGMYMLPKSKHPIASVNIGLLHKIILDFMGQNS